MDSADFAALKAYMKVSGPADDEDIGQLAQAAAAYLREAGAQPPELRAGERLSERYPLYFLALKALTLHWFDNRDAITAGTASLTPLGAASIIKQLQAARMAAEGEA